MADDNKNQDSKGDQNTASSSQKTDEVQALKDRISALEKEKQDWSSKNAQDNQSLNDKARLEREDRDRKNADSKALESALTFSLTSSEFLKQNESILPKGASEIFKLADKEKYDSPIQKSNAIKAGLIDLHFGQQSHVDYLTDYQKEALADYQKLTKNGKEEKANEIYNTLFIPNLNMIKQVKKTEELAKAKNGFGGNTDADQAYKSKLTEMAQKKFFRGRN